MAVSLWAWSLFSDGASAWGGTGGPMSELLTHSWLARKASGMRASLQGRAAVTSATRSARDLAPLGAVSPAGRYFDGDFEGDADGAGPWAYQMREKLKSGTLSDASGSPRSSKPVMPLSGCFSLSWWRKRAASAQEPAPSSLIWMVVYLARTV